MKRGKQIDTWFPLWIDKWIFGSTRHELIIQNDDGTIDDLRGIFLDLMALAKKDGGYIRANETTPYPHLQLAGMFCIPLLTLEKAIEVCLRYGKLTEPIPGIYYLKSDQVYSLTERHMRRVMSENPDMMSENPDARGEESREEKSKEEEKKVGRIQLILNESPKRWDGITEEDMELWARTYPGVDIRAALQEMIAFWDANRQNLRSDWKRTIVNRLHFLQDQSKPDGGFKRPGYQVSQVGSTPADKDAAVRRAVERNRKNFPELEEEGK